MRGKVNQRRVANFQGLGQLVTTEWEDHVHGYSDHGGVPDERYRAESASPLVGDSGRGIYGVGHPRAKGLPVQPMHLAKGRKFSKAGDRKRVNRCAPGTVVLSVRREAGGTKRVAVLWVKQMRSLNASGGTERRVLFEGTCKREFSIRRGYKHQRKESDCSFSSSNK